MAGTIPLSMTQQFDASGNVLSGGQLYIIQAGTTSTPQIAYQDSALNIPVAGGSVITLSAAGRIPQFFLADGSIKIRLTDKNGVTQIVQDGILVVGASSGGGGGSPVDPTTVLQTGWVQPIYGTGVISGFVRLNARTIGSATSGATERANADTAALFAFLWNADANLAVSGGRGASAAADYAANKTIALPDFRGRVPAALGDMGNADANLLNASYFGASGTTLGAVGGSQNVTLAANQIPAGVPSSNASQAISVTADGTGRHVPSSVNATVGVPASATTSSFAGISAPSGWGDTTSFSGANSIGVTSTNASQAAARTVQPTILLTYYVKL